MNALCTVQNVGPSVSRHLVIWLTAGLLLAVPTPLAAAPSGKEKQKLGAAESVARGTTPARITERAPVNKPSRPAGRDQAARSWNHQLRKLPQRQDKTARREVAMLRQWYRTALPALANPQRTRLLESWQIRLIDGDTFATGTERIRIKGVNAPETSESGGFEATQRLDLLLHEGPVLVIPYGKDTYGRTLAEVYVNNRNVAEVLKEEGHNKQR